MEYGLALRRVERVFAPLWIMEEALGRLRHGWFGLEEAPGIFASVQEVDHRGQRIVDWSLIDANAKGSTIASGTEPNIVAAKIAAEKALWNHMSAHQRIAVTTRLDAR
jgi:hypothetical protein